MVNLLLFAVFALQGSSAPSSRPEIKRCPDGSTILASDVCAPSLEHRFSMTHEPEAQVHTTEWWCSGDQRPSLAQFRIRQPHKRSARGTSSAPFTTVELVTLKVKGKPPSASTMRLVRRELAPLNNLGNLGGRCLFRRSGGTQSVLTLRGYEQGRRDPHNLEFELD